MGRDHDAKDGGDRTHSPESIREWLSEIVRELAQPGYHGSVQIAFASRNGKLYGWRDQRERTH